jgi:predicted DNA binding protein
MEHERFRGGKIMYLVSKVSWSGLTTPIEQFNTMQQAKTFVKQNKDYKFVITKDEMTLKDLIKTIDLQNNKGVR